MQIEQFLQHYFNAIGMVGVVMVLATYAALQMRKIDPTTILYSVLNTIGSVLILISLCFTWNLASGVIEIAWLVISLYGLCRAVKGRYPR